ncbi:MAG: sulfite exporter TauE/SafE family protein, partial [Rhodobacteraceae bacterium]|nr:sulfite exporter TauE/SafE family protein [Paracoccaceae bacterium]
LLASRISSQGLVLIFGTGVTLMAVHFLFPVLSGRHLRDQLPSGVGRAAIATGLGTFSSLLGIGGGTITTIVMTLCGNSIHRSIGTSSGVGVIIAVPGMIGFMAIGLGSAGLPYGSLGYVNLPATLAIVATSVITAPWGVAAAHKLSPALLTRIFGIYLLVIGIVMIRRGMGM